MLRDARNDGERRPLRLLEAAGSRELPNRENYEHRALLGQSHQGLPCEGEGAAFRAVSSQPLSQGALKSSMSRRGSRR